MWINHLSTICYSRPPFVAVALAFISVVVLLLPLLLFSGWRFYDFFPSMNQMNGWLTWLTTIIFRVITTDQFLCCDPQPAHICALRQGHGELQLRLHSERVALHAICAGFEATGSKQHEHRDANGSLVVLGCAWLCLVKVIALKNILKEHGPMGPPASFG